MASNDGSTLPNVKRAQVAARARKTQVLTENWQRKRQASLKAQLAVNTELKQRWLELDHREAQQVRVAMSEATESRPSPPRGTRLNALLAAASTRVNTALTYLVSALGFQRFANQPGPGSLS